MTSMSNTQLTEDQHIELMRKYSIIMITGRANPILDFHGTRHTTRGVRVGGGGGGSGCD